MLMMDDHGALLGCCRVLVVVPAPVGCWFFVLEKKPLRLLSVFNFLLLLAAMVHDK